MIRRKVLLLALALSCCALALAWITLRARPVANSAVESLWSAPRFARPDQDGLTVSDSSLRGHVWIADFIYTTCTSACPILSARMVALQRQLTDPSLRFISFSVDPEHDTPRVLRDYAARWRSSEPRWRLLANTPESLREIAAGLHAVAQATGNAQDPFFHSISFFLVDQAGQVRGLYDSDSDEHTRKLRADVGALLAAPAAQASPAAPADGAALLFELGCMGCHGAAPIAPPLTGVFGHKVEFFDDHSTIADEAYLRESILHPYEKLVKGYGPSMPSYDWLEPAQVDALVARLAELGAQGSAPAPRALESDPVCHMKVSAADDVPHAEWHGKTYWFCNDECRKDFVKTPEKFAGGAQGK